MILTEGGRNRSIRTPEEEWAEIEKDLKGLTPEERVAFMAILEEQGHGGTQLRDHFVQQEYVEPPVDVETFLREEYYFGKIGKAMWPKLRDDMVEMFHGGYEEVILGGSIGSGKSYLATCALSYVLYQMLCLKEPQRSYGIDAGSAIALAMISVNEKKARDVVLQELWGKLEQSAYFMEKSGAAKQFMGVKFPRNIMMVAGTSTESSIIGLNLFGAIMDESNFMGVSSQQQAASHERWGYIDNAETLYTSIRRRMKSRFMQGGKLPGMLFLLSSKVAGDSFTDRRIEEARNDPRVFVRERATWDVVPARFSGRVFPVLVGSEKARPRILVGDPATAVAEAKKLKAAGEYVIDVPEEYRKDFERNLESSLQEIAGVASQSVASYVSRREKIVDAVDPDLPDPFPTLTWAENAWICGTKLDIDWSAIARKVTKRLPGGYQEEVWEPLRHPNATRFGHIDGSLNKDATGLAMGHRAGLMEVVRRDAKDREIIELAPLIEIDFVLRIVAAPSDEIELGIVRSILYQFIEHGFPLMFCSTDRWQSVECRQKLNAKGIKSEVVSVDDTTQPYELTKEALYESRLKYAGHPVLQRELRDLQLKGKGGAWRIDHLPKSAGGTKDCSDAVGGVVFNVTTRSEGMPVGPMKGETVHGTQKDRDSMDDGAWVTGGRVVVPPGVTRPQPSGGGRGGGGSAGWPTNPFRRG